MRLRITAVLILISVCSVLYAIEIKHVIAYPVPFNPKKGVLTIGFDPLYPDAASYRVGIKIFDINGDLVTDKNVSGFPVRWNGRNTNGKYVKPGMYIIRVSAETESGDYGKRLIRILVNY